MRLAHLSHIYPIKIQPFIMDRLNMPWDSFYMGIYHGKSYTTLLYWCHYGFSRLGSSHKTLRRKAEVRLVRFVEADLGEENPRNGPGDLRWNGDDIFEYIISIYIYIYIIYIGLGGGFNVDSFHFHRFQTFWEDVCFNPFCYFFILGKFS